MDSAERQRVLAEWNATATDYERDASIHALFARQAALTPDAVAAVFGDTQLTYAELDRRAISLAEVTGTTLDLNRLAAALIGRVLLAYDAFAEGTHVHTFADLWNRYDILRGKSIALLEGGRRHHGTVTGIDDEGALLLRDGNRTHRFRAGEVTLEKAS